VPLVFAGDPNAPGGRLVVAPEPVLLYRIDQLDREDQADGAFHFQKTAGGCICFHGSLGASSRVDRRWSTGAGEDG
jgi:hypothetical protein